jgi:periplasmic protein TonB
MGQPARALAPMAQPAARYPILLPKPPEPDFAFRSLVFTAERPLVRRRGLTVAVSIAVHLVLLVAAVAVPLLLFEDVLPAPDVAVRAFFATPAQMAPAPPPPPPPAPAARVKAAVAPVPPPEPGRFLAPVETPETMPVDEGIDMGVEGGVPGGVEGGVPGGVVGGVIGGLPQEAPPPPTRVVRVGGNIRAPKLVHEVKPVYPELALQARAAAMVILEAQVGTDGRVRTVRVLRGHPIFDQAAIDAVQQWRYQPLLLNGLPTEFILTVTMSFKLRTPAAGE